MRLWRCQICGGPYTGEEKPQTCQFCGAHENYIVLQGEYTDRLIKVEGLTDVSRENLEETLALEVDNIKFYTCAAKKTDDGSSLFKGLSLNETAHSMVVCKALGIPRPAIEDVDVCSGDFHKDLIEAHSREHRAINRYEQFLSEAIEPRVQEIFRALVEIESDHIALAKEHMKLHEA
jgi:rubrerythrin